MIEDENYFLTYDSFPDSDILFITDEGIRLTTGLNISFKECARVFAEQKCAPLDSAFVGEHDSTALEFVFYTPVHPTSIRFLERNRFAELFGTPVYKRFRLFQKKISDKGYRTYDMS